MNALWYDLKVALRTLSRKRVYARPRNSLDPAESPICTT